MARFQMELPTDILKDFKKINDDADKIFGDMTRAGAEVAMQNIKANAPTQELARGVKLSRTYKTPTDDGINTKVYISGYAPFRNGRTYFSRRGRQGSRTYVTTQGVPLEFIANIFEYGTSPRFTDAGAYRGYVGKKPFFRKGFKKAQIEKVMLEVQKRESGGLLE